MIDGFKRSFGLQYREWVRAAVPNLFDTRDWLRGRQFFRGPGWRGGGRLRQQYERWGAADEASLAVPPPTSCCAARGPVVGDPWLRGKLGRRLLHIQARVDAGLG